MDQGVTLEQMLEVREARQARIRASLHRAPLISFSLNIPGPVKDSALIRRGFHEGCRALGEGFAAENFALTLLWQAECVTGCEALYAADGDAQAVKRLCAAIEDANELGRLFDMDVIDSDGRKLDRAELGLSERGCMVCGAPGRGCAARRKHSVDELQRETARRLTGYFKEHDRARIAALAVRSLLDEVNTTPKPGLVDRANNGSHTDMDLPLFEKSAAALAPYWSECVMIGMETAALAPEETFARLRCAGLGAEETMLAATGGVNTHKGAVFLLGVLCGALGRLWDAAAPCKDIDKLCEECARLTNAPLREEFDRMRKKGIEGASTAGARLYLRQGLRGARGESMDGLPGVRVALPALKDALARGCERDHAAAIALLHLIARGTDTNMVKRGGTDGAAWGAAEAEKLLKDGALPAVEKISALDRQFMKKNLSPGGCADLLALTLFLYEWEAEE